MATLLRGAEMKPVAEGDLQAWRRLSHLATANLATTADLREQYAIERRMRQGSFKPLLEMLAEQQRALLLARALATGRFLDQLPPPAATERLDAAMDAQAERLERLSVAFEQPDATEATMPPLPTPAETRAAATDAGCSAEDVARLLYRRDAIAMLAATLERAERLRRDGFAWVNGRLESVLEIDPDAGETGRAADMLAATS
jgi:hypothetical protein